MEDFAPILSKEEIQYKVAKRAELPNQTANKQPHLHPGVEAGVIGNSVRYRSTSGLPSTIEAVRRIESARVIAGLTRPARKPLHNKGEIMPQYLLANYLPDDFDPSTVTEATVRAINDLNDELEAAGARLMACGLQPSQPGEIGAGAAQWRSARHRRPVSGNQGAHWRFLDTGSRRHGRGAGVGPQGCLR